MKELGWLAFLAFIVATSLFAVGHLAPIRVLVRARAFESDLPTDAPDQAALWFACGLFAAPIVGIAVAYGVCEIVRERHSALEAQSGVCKQCGYSLKGLASRRCPECGSAF